MDLSKWMTIGYFSIIFLFVGIFLFGTFLFWNFILMIVGLSFLIASVIGLALVRRNVSILKRTNPEAIEALKAESDRACAKEKTLSLRDLPPWLIALMIIAVVVGFLGADLHAFAFNPMLEILLSAFTLFFVIYYFAYYRRKLMKKKYPQHQVNHSSAKTSP